MFRFELTDTFGGEANYAWVRRASIPDTNQTALALVRRAKAWAGWQGLRCDVQSHGTEEITIRPRGICQVLFISYDGSAEATCAPTA